MQTFSSTCGSPGLSDSGGVRIKYLSGGLSDDPPLNPYAAPQAELRASELPLALSATAPIDGGNVGTIVTAWISVFLLNLPIATLLGLSLCKNFAGLGVLAAIAGFLVLTLCIIRHAGRFAGCWIAGAACVALSQFLPYLHFILGAFAVNLFQDQGNELNVFGALCCSLIVGGGLIAVSLALAGIFYFLFVSWDQR